MPYTAVLMLKMLSPDMDGNFIKLPLRGCMHGGFHLQGTHDSKKCVMLCTYTITFHQRISKYFANANRVSSTVLCLQEVFNTSIPANFLVKSLTPPWFFSPRTSLHSAPRRSRKGETDSCRLLKDFPDSRRETLQCSLALPLMQMGLKATGEITTKDRSYTTCCLKTDFTSYPKDVLGPHTLLWNPELLLSQSRRKHLHRTDGFSELMWNSPGRESCTVMHSPLQSVGAGEECSSHETAGTSTILDFPYSQAWEKGFLSPALSFHFSCSEEGISPSISIMLRDPLELTAECLIPSSLMFWH